MSIKFSPYSGAKSISQPPIVQVLPLKKMREACNFHHRYTSNYERQIRKTISRKSHCRIFKEFICKLWWKISIWSPTNKQDCWLSQTCNFFFKRLLCPPLVTCINGHLFELVISIKDTCPQPQTVTLQTPLWPWPKSCQRTPETKL